VNLEPARGGELQKDNRPVLVLSHPGIGIPGVSLCAPITDFKPGRDKLRYWRVVIGDNETSGLNKLSCADVSQMRALDVSRFVSHDGRAHPAEVAASAAALALCVGYAPLHSTLLEPGSNPEP
jgi:mRNA-degrading endonuclease toxin of MazEF toxin-antitoxin module